MKYKAFNTYVREDFEPILRSCWECNQLHDHLKNRTELHLCFLCGRYFIFGRFLDDFKSEEEMDVFLKERLERIDGA